MKKKILLIENSVSHIAPGGSHKSLLNLYNQLDRSIYDPFILLNQKSQYFSEMFSGINVLYIDHQTLDIKPDSKSGFISKNNSKNKSSYFMPLRVQLGILYRIFRDVIPMTYKTIKVIKNLDVDLIHTNTRIGSNQFGILAGWVCKKKIISHERTWTKKNWFNKFIIKIPDKIICISNAIKKNILSIGIEDEKCEIIFNGRVFSNVPEQIINKYEDETSEPFKVGLMANISEYKGHTVFVKTAIELLKKYPNFKFYIYGDLSTPDKNYLKSLKDLVIKNNHEKQIIFKGYVKNVNTIIQKLHVNCCLTLGEEPLSGTIIESFINKTVIIATNTGGSTELIENNVNGLIINPNSVKSFFQSLEHIYKNKSKAKNIVRNGYEFAKDNLSADIYAEKVSKIYTEILK